MSVEEQVKSLLSAFAKVPLSKILPKSNLRKMGIDSLMALELVAKLERMFKIHISEGKIRGIVRVDQIVDAVHALRSSATKAGSDRTQHFGGAKKRRTVSV